MTITKCDRCREDKGANYLCEKHRLEAKKIQMVKDLMQRGLDAWQENEDKLLAQDLKDYLNVIE